MLILIYLTVFLFGVDAHIKFTECQAEYYRNQPGNQDVVFETDGEPCQTEARALIDYYRWNHDLQNGKHIVPYFFEDGYENHQYGSVNATEAMERMEEMLDHFKIHTCVEFVRLRTEEEKNQYDYKIKIYFHHLNGCGSWSNLGRLPLHYQPQRIHMCPGIWALQNNTTMQHESMHALGFKYEHNRPDRDDFVEIHPSVAGYGFYVKFSTENWVDTNSPYDFDSIMHYPAESMGSGEYYISVPGSNYQTPVTTNPVYPFSEEDIKQINYAYCSGKGRNS